MTLLKCCTQYVRKFGKLSSGHRTRKSQFSFQSQRRTVRKNVQNYYTVAFISHASKVMLKTLQPGLQQYMYQEPPDVQAGFRKGRGTRDQIASIRWLMKKAREFQNKSTSASLTTPKPLTVWIMTDWGKFLKRWECQTTLPVS